MKARKYDHVTPLLRELHWLPVSHRIKFKILVLLHKSYFGNGPAYLKNMLHKYTPARCLRSSEEALRFTVPKTKLKTFGDRAFSVLGPALWNELPSKVRKIESISKFKIALKTLYFNQCYKAS